MKKSNSTKQQQRDLSRHVARNNNTSHTQTIRGGTTVIVAAVVSAIATLTVLASVTGAALVLSSTHSSGGGCRTSLATTTTTKSNSILSTTSSLMPTRTVLSMSPTASTPQRQQQDEDFEFKSSSSTSRSNKSSGSAGSSLSGSKASIASRRGQQQQLGSTLRMICDEQREFEMNVGRAVDILQRDYPYILTDQPDFSIYADDIEITDPSGVKLHGLSNYKTFFRLIHFIVNTFYCPDRSGLTFRLVYDCTRSNVRVHWNAYVIPKAIFGGTKTTLHVDGISVYEICRGSGKITQHRVEHLLINDIPIQPAEGIFHALHQEVDPDFIPVFNTGGGGNNVVQFQPSLRLLGIPPKVSSLFSMSSSATSSDDDSSGGQPGGTFTQPIDWAAFERKNASRKKFGMAPLTPEEFVQLEGQVQQMDHQRRQAAAASAAAEMSKKKQNGGDNNLLKKLFGDVLEDTCESNFDCERPLVCCDFGFKKSCCFSGTRVVEGRPAMVPVPVETGYPPQGRGGPPRNFIVQ